MANRRTRKQHWVPQFYLRHFANEKEYLAAYRKSDNAFFSASVKDVCAKNNLHEVRGNPSTGNGIIAPNYIEKLLADVESNIAPRFTILLNCLNHRDLTSKDYLLGRYATEYLLAHLLVRHPLVLDKERKKADSLAKQHFTRHKLTKKEEDILVRLRVEKDEHALAELAIMQGYLFGKDSILPVNRILEALGNKCLALIEAPPGTYFVSTDFPIFVEGQRDSGYDFYSMYMPLSSQYAALFIDERRTDFLDTASVNEVGRFNSALLRLNPSWETAFCRSQGSLETSVRDYKLFC